MNSIDRYPIAEILFCLDWRSPNCKHRDCYFASNVNFWRDFFTPDHFEKLKGAEPGDAITLHNSRESPLYSYHPELVYHIKTDQFKGRTPEGRRIVPCFGRFYPQGFIKGIPGVFPQNKNICRCTAVDGKNVEMDFNHPLAGRKVDVSAEIISVTRQKSERGGRCEDWLETISTNGPGAQVLLSQTPSDFSGDDAMRRDEESPDDLFYKKARFVQHIDTTAESVIQELYAGRLSPGYEVLDLMASWDSHIPENISLGRLVTLGLNREELEANSLADETVFQDINANPELPFGADSFDAVICTVSVEYITRPAEVFEEIARVLRPGGIVLMTFSNRWFEPKVIHIWRDLHEFERLGLVTSYLLETEKFKDIETFSIRGQPRPEDDKYAWQLPFSDPVYLVAGRRI